MAAHLKKFAHQTALGFVLVPDERGAARFFKDRAHPQVRQKDGPGNLQGFKEGGTGGQHRSHTREGQHKECPDAHGQAQTAWDGAAPAARQA